MKTVEQITEILENQSEYDLKELWNDYQADIRGNNKFMILQMTSLRTFLVHRLKLQGLFSLVKLKAGMQIS